MNVTRDDGHRGDCELDLKAWLVFWCVLQPATMSSYAPGPRARKRLAASEDWKELMSAAMGLYNPLLGIGSKVGCLLVMASRGFASQQQWMVRVWVVGVPLQVVQDSLTTSRPLVHCLGFAATRV